MMSFTQFAPILALFAFAVASLNTSLEPRKRWECTVPASGDSHLDDAPAIIDAFKECNKHGGKVIFTNTTYYINSVMNTTGLKNVDVDINGTLKWSTDIDYWLSASLPVGYQNQSTAWYFGGDNIHINGYGYGTIDGNGQVWYDFVKGASNYPRRPHGVTLTGLTNSVVEGVRFVQSQMWTMSIIHSKNTTLDSIYISSVSSNGNPARNTDGADTLYSSGLTFSNWVVYNGDDSISFKANSTDMIIKDCKFYKGLGIAFGSIGQYKGVYETIERVKVSRVEFFSTRHAVYFKTWTGEQVGYPPNGGGGGLGYAQDLSFNDLKINATRDPPFSITQCTTFSGTPGNCTSSQFQVRNVTLKNMSGTGASSKIAEMKCAAITCPFITIKDMDVISTVTGNQVTGYSCSNVRNYTGFAC